MIPQLSMLNPEPAWTNNSSIVALERRAREITPEDVERQYLEPARWLEFADAILRGFEDRLREKDADDAATYLSLAHDIFFKAGLRGPSRTALGCMAKLAEEFDVRTDFEFVAARELALPIPFFQIQDRQLQVSLAANELRCWNAARPLLEYDTGLAKRLIETSTSLIHAADTTWQTAAQNKLWEVHSASTALCDFSSSSTNLPATEAVLMSCATRYLADFILPLAQQQELRGAPPESPLRPLEYGAQAALDEYLDLEIQRPLEEMNRFIAAGDGSAFSEYGISMSDCIGRLLHRLQDLEQIERCCFRFFSIWRSWWTQSRGAPSRSVGALMQAQTDIISRACTPLLLTVSTASDTHDLAHLARVLHDFVRSPETKQARAPATNIAPIRLLCGRIWERIAELDDDSDAAQQALEEYVEASRLLTQTSLVQQTTARDLIASIERLPEVRPLLAWEQGVVSVLRGMVALGLKKNAEALNHLSHGIKHLREAISDPELQGLKSLTLLTARVCGDASRTAEQLDEHRRSIAFLNLAAEILDNTASIFKIDTARLELQAEATRYREKVAKKAPKNTPSSGDSAAPEVS